MMTLRPTRHWFGLTDRLNPPAYTRWVNVITVGPEMARLEAEEDNPGFTAHDAYVLLGEQPWERFGLFVWRVELWKDPR